MGKCGKDPPEREWGLGKTVRTASTELGAYRWQDLATQRAQDEHSCRGNRRDKGAGAGKQKVCL